MAVVRIPREDRVVRDEEGVRAELAAIGIDYERWDLSRVPENSDAAAVLAAYEPEIAAMKQRGGYRTADVIDVSPETPDLDAMLRKFDREHTHSEDEVRFILAGRGIFFLRPKPLASESLDSQSFDSESLGFKTSSSGNVVSVEVTAGDLIRVPRDTPHWFTLCADRRIRAIRWFQDTTGWMPRYTDTGVDRGYEPVCFGPVYFGSRGLVSRVLAPVAASGLDEGHGR